MQNVLKRNGKIEEFNSSKIENAIIKAGAVTNEIDEKAAKNLTRNVLKIIKDFVRNKESNLKSPTIEEIQDIVEQVL